MWPFEPRGRRQVYESGGSGGVDAGGGGYGDGGYSVEQGGGYSGTVDSGTSGGTPGGGGYSAEQGGGYSGTTGAGVTDTSGTSGLGSMGGGWGSAYDPATGVGVGSPAPSSDAPAPSGGEPAPSGETGVPGGVAPAGSGPQPGLDTVDPGLGDIGGYTAPGAVSREGALGAPPGFESIQGVNYTGELAPGYTPDFGSIVDQFGPSLTSDPFTTSDDERQGAPTLSQPADPYSDTITSTVSQPPGGIVMSGRVAPGDDTAIPEVPGATPGPGTAPGTAPGPSSGSAGTPGATPGSAPDVSASGGGATPADPLAGLPPLPYTPADVAASQPSPNTFAPEPNIGTAIMQAIFGLGGATIGGPISGFLNQNVPAVIGGVGGPISAAASVLGNAQTIAGVTGATRGMAGSPMERAQPNIASMLWDELNGRPSRSRGISPIGGALRPSIASWLLSRDNRTPVGENPPPDPRTYDRGQLLAAGQLPRGVAQLLSPREQVLANMVPQDFDLTGGNQAGDNRLVDDMLLALGLEPTTPQDPVPTTRPTPEQMPFDMPAYFAGGQSDLNPVIQGQRTAFDPRLFIA